MAIHYDPSRCSLLGVYPHCPARRSRAAPPPALCPQKEGVQIPLKEAMGVKGGLGKTKGTEHRVTLNTPSREWELGSGEEGTAKEWADLLQQWVGLPKVERMQRPSQTGEASVVKAQWMEVRNATHHDSSDS